MNSDKKKSQIFSKEVEDHLEALKNGTTEPRMLTAEEIRLSREHAKQVGARIRARFIEMGVKPKK